MTTPLAPGYIALIDQHGRPVAVNASRICAYGKGDPANDLKHGQVWLALAGRKKLLWVTSTMGEIASAISDQKAQGNLA